MIHLSARLSRIVALVVFLLAAAISGTTGVTAQTEPPADEFVYESVAAVFCADDDCSEFADSILGFTFTAIDTATSETVASCTTDASSAFQGCTLEIPVGVDYDIRWDQAQEPEGFEWIGSPISVDGVTFIAFSRVAPETEQVLVNAALCTDPGCFEFSENLVGFTIYALDNNTGDPLDSCVTDAGSQGNICILEVPVGGDIAFDWIPEEVPAGYLFRDVIISDGEMGPIVNTLAFSQAEEPTEEPTGEPTEEPTQEPTEAPTETPGTTPESTATATPQVKVLPSTGSGDSSNVAGLAVLATGLIAAAGLMVASRKLNIR